MGMKFPNFLRDIIAEIADRKKCLGQMMYYFREAHNPEII
jgi:hypothetical protein